MDITDDRCGPMEWSRVVLPQESQDLQVGCCRVSDASVGDGAAHGDRQQTTPSSRFGVDVVVDLPPGQSTHLNVRVGNGG